MQRLASGGFSMGFNALKEEEHCSWLELPPATTALPGGCREEFGIAS